MGLWRRKVVEGGSNCGAKNSLGLIGGEVGMESISPGLG